MGTIFIDIMPRRIPVSAGCDRSHDLPHMVGAGELLPCEYTGDVLTFARLRRLPEAERDYVMGLHFNTHVDAKRHPHVIARYINDNLLGPRAEVRGATMLPTNPLCD